MNARKLLSITALGLLLAMPASAQKTKDQLIMIQTQVQALQDDMARMQQSFNERMGIMRSLVEQTTDNINKLNQTMTSVEKLLQQQSNEGAGQVERVSGQVQSLHDSVDELKARVAKLGQQLDEIRNMQQTLSSPADMAAGGGGAEASMAPPPDVLYNNALRDYNAGRYDLAGQQFTEYMKFYGSTEMAGNAQFYLADIQYRLGAYEQAVKEYDKVIEQFPGGNKAAAAQLKKGYALLELGQRQAGIRELNSLIARYPRAPETAQARDRLRKLGASASSEKPSPRRQ